MRLAGPQDAATLQLLKVFLEALPSQAEAGVRGGAKTALEARTSAQAHTPTPAPAPAPKMHPGSPPGFSKPAPVSADAVAAQMLGAAFAERDIAASAPAQVRGEIDARTEREPSDARREEPAQAQAKPGVGNGPIPWPNEALAAYSARPAKLGELQAGGGRAREALGGRGDGGGVKPGSLKLVRRALVYACVIGVLLLVLLNRKALFG